MKRHRKRKNKIRISFAVWLRLVLLFIVTCSALPCFANISDYYNVNRLSNPGTSVTVTPAANDIIASYKLKDPLIYCFMVQESSLNPKAYLKADSDGTPRYGILQFKRETYIENCVFKYGYDYNDIWDVTNQAECTRRMINDGMVKRWGLRTRINCSKYF